MPESQGFPTAQAGKGYQVQSRMMWVSRLFGQG